MNKRIRELFSKSCWDEQMEADIEDFINVQKFAELIVRECAELVASRPYIDDGNWSHPSTMIKQHFGVEE